MDFGGGGERKEKSCVCGAKMTEIRDGDTTTKAAAAARQSNAVQSRAKGESNTKQRKRPEEGRTDEQPSLGCTGMDLIGIVGSDGGK
jgi:hypothetical protein